MTIYIRIVKESEHRFTVRATTPNTGHVEELRDLTWSEALDQVDRLAHEDGCDVRAIGTDGIVRLKAIRR